MYLFVDLVDIVHRTVGIVVQQQTLDTHIG